MKLEIVGYRADWPKIFADEADRLRRALPPNFVLEHIGSTAVPGLAAKPIVDMMLGAPTLAEIEAQIPTVVALGYEYMPQHEAALPMRRFFAKPLAGPRVFHLHAVAIGETFWRDHLRFRDRLRADAAFADEYATLKRSLAIRFKDDRDGYTDAKTAFIRQAIAFLGT